MASEQLQLGIRDLGLSDYQQTLDAMRDFTDTRQPDTPDQLWLLEHPRVFTLGQAGKPEHVLMTGDIPVIKVERGGQVTYHGPGQLVVYPLLDIDRRGLGVRELVCQLEQVIIDVLGDYGLSAQRIAGKPGVFLGEHKIAALGLRIRKGRSFHGLALNIDMNLEPYQRINPCGFAGQPVIDLRRACLQLSSNSEAAVEPSEITLQRVQHRFVQHFLQQFGYTL